METDPLRLLTNKINPEVRKYAQALYDMTRKYPDTSGQWCGRGWDNTGSKEHASGLAFDWITSTKVGLRPTNVQYVAAMKIVNFFIRHGKEMGLEWLIFSVDGKNKMLYNVARGKWRNYGSKGNISFRHIDHIHFKFLKSVKFNPNINWILDIINTKTNKGKEITVTDKEMEAIVLKLLNFKVTANGKNQALVQHMVEGFVDDEAQSKALAEISTKISALANQVAEIRKAVR